MDNATIMLNALKVIALDPDNRTAIDPKALQQVEEAIIAVEGLTPELAAARNSGADPDELISDHGCINGELGPDEDCPVCEGEGS